MAALDAALAAAIADLPSEQVKELKLAFGNVMAEVMDKIINPAVAAFPELVPDGATWVEIATQQARQLSLTVLSTQTNHE